MINQTPNTNIFEMMNYIYPVGSVFITTSVQSVDAMHTLFGGTWSKIQDKFLLASGTKTLGATGGEEAHILTTTEMPSHTHTINSSSPSQTLNAICSTGGSNSNTYGRGGTNSTKMSNYTVTLNHTHTADSTGGSVAHNNMPPYLVVNVFKRETLWGGQLA